MSGLFDYAEQHPCTEAPAPARPMKDYRGNAQRAAELMDEITAKMKQASPPQAVLMEAFSLIGILADKEEWAEEMRGRLSVIYGMEDAPTLFPAAEADRLRAAQEDFKEKTVRKLTRSAAACAALERELRAAIRAAQDLTEPDGGEEESGTLDIPL